MAEDAETLAPREAVLAVLNQQAVEWKGSLEEAADAVLYAVRAADRGWSQDELLDTPEKVVSALYDTARDGRSFTVLGRTYRPNVDGEFLAIDLTRNEAVVMRVILETHMIFNGETELVRRLHDRFAAITLHTGAGVWSGRGGD